MKWLRPELAPVLVSSLAVVACGDSSTAPAEPHAAASVRSSAEASALRAESGHPDIQDPPVAIALEAALGDALVQEGLGGLEDPVLAAELSDALASLLDTVDEPGPKGHAKAFAEVRRLISGSLLDPNTSGEDEIAISVLEIALLSVRGVGETQ